MLRFQVRATRLKKTKDVFWSEGGPVAPEATSCVINFSPCIVGLGYGGLKREC